MRDLFAGTDRVNTDIAIVKLRSVLYKDSTSSLVRQVAPHASIALRRKVAPTQFYHGCHYS